MEQTMSYKRTLIYDDLVDLLDDVVVVDVLDHDNSSINSTRAAVTAIDAMKPKPNAAQRWAMPITQYRKVLILSSLANQNDVLAT